MAMKFRFQIPITLNCLSQELQEEMEAQHRDKKRALAKLQKVRERLFFPFVSASAFMPFICCKFPLVFCDQAKMESQGGHEGLGEGASVHRTGTHGPENNARCLSLYFIAGSSRVSNLMCGHAHRMCLTQLWLDITSRYLQIKLPCRQVGRWHVNAHRMADSASEHLGLQVGHASERPADNCGSGVVLRARPVPSAGPQGYPDHPVPGEFPQHPICIIQLLQNSATPAKQRKMHTRQTC